MAKTDWLRLLGYVTGLVNQELLLRNEYLVAENRILKARIKGRLRLSGDMAGQRRAPPARSSEFAREIRERRWRQALRNRLQAPGASAPQMHPHAPDSLTSRADWDKLRYFPLLRRRPVLRFVWRVGEDYAGRSQSQSGHYRAAPGFVPCHD